MGKGRGKGKGKTDSQRANQRARTRANKIKKYTKLIEQRPNDIHVPIWKDKLNKL
jgi:hypothetical protein